jgi:hypothetical protein
MIAKIMQVNAFLVMFNLKRNFINYINQEIA